MAKQKEKEIPDEVAMQLFEDMGKLVKSVNDNLPFLLLESACDIEKRILETEFKGLI